MAVGKGIPGGIVSRFTWDSDDLFNNESLEGTLLRAIKVATKM